MTTARRAVDRRQRFLASSACLEQAKARRPLPRHLSIFVLNSNGSVKKRSRILSLLKAIDSAPAVPYVGPVCRLTHRHHRAVVDSFSAMRDGDIPSCQGYRLCSSLHVAFLGLVKAPLNALPPVRFSFRQRLSSCRLQRSLNGSGTRCRETRTAFSRHA